MNMLKLFITVITVAALNGCMTTGFSFAKDPKMVQKWEGAIISVAPENIYNATGVFWVGPFASVESHGLKVQFLTDTGETVTIVQPATEHYQLHAGQRGIYIVDRGQVWVQPIDFPLPEDFSSADKKSESKDSPKNIVPASENKSATNAPPKPAKSPSDSSPSTPTSKDDSSRLEKLKALKDRGVISQEEYEKKRKEIIDSI